MENINNKPFKETNLEQTVGELFQKEGYELLENTKVHRQFSDVVLLDDLKKYLGRKYGDENLSESEISYIINKIVNCNVNNDLYENSKAAYKLVTQGFTLERKNQNQDPIHIDYIDFDDEDKNIFKVIRQFEVQGKEQTRIPDIIVFINGIPVSIWEFKSTLKEDTTIKDAWEQIFYRYNQDIDNLTRFCFLSVISDGAETKLGSVMTSFKNYYPWSRVHEDQKQDVKLSSIETMVQGVFTKKRILEILRDFIIYPDSNDSNRSPIVARYPQYFGAKKLVKNIIKHINEGDGKGGTYAGATGCGKTYTMIFAAELLFKRYNEETNNPTIIIIEDRDDLAEQTSDYVTGAATYMNGGKVETIETRDLLKSKLGYIESGGVYITTIQKFCANTGLLSKRKNIICFSDEAHRTQLNMGEGIKIKEDKIIDTIGFAKILRTSFPNAVYCGFSGTPIDETYNVFGEIVDSYTMKEAENDGITVGIVYTDHSQDIEQINEITKLADEYYKEQEKNGTSKEQIEKSKRMMSSISTIYSSEAVLDYIARDIIDDYEKRCKEKPKSIQKAMIVCADRTLALNIYKKIASYRKDWIVAKKESDDRSKYNSIAKMHLVMTRGKNDSEEVRRLAGTKDYRNKLAKYFKKPSSNFQIAIVSDMWITGFDVKPLTMMYLIKPVQSHQLIQTISRVNRVWEDKTKGIIIDYVHLYDRIVDAMKKYNRFDDYEIPDVDSIANTFKEELERIEIQMQDFDSSKYFDINSSDEERWVCITKAADFVQRTKETQDEFMDSVLNLKNTFETALTSKKITEDERGEAYFYMVIRSYIYKQTKNDTPDAEVMNSEVEEILKNALRCTGVPQIFEEKDTKDLFSEDTLKQIQEMETDATKINALCKYLAYEIEEYSKINNIKSEEFSEMFDETIKKYNSRKTPEADKSINETVIDEMLNILNRIKEDKEEIKRLGLSPKQKAFYDILTKTKKRYTLDITEENCKNLALEIDESTRELTQYVDWTTRYDILAEIKKRITILLGKYNFPLTNIDSTKLIHQIIEQIS